MSQTRKKGETVLEARGERDTHVAYTAYGVGFEDKERFFVFLLKIFLFPSPFLLTYLTPFFPLDDTVRYMSSISLALPSLLLLLLLKPLRQIQAQGIRVQIQFILPGGFLQDRGHAAGVLDPAEIDVAFGFLERFADQLGRLGFALRSHDRRLFLLSGFVDYEGGPLRFLLRYLLGFDGGGEFGGEGEVL